MCVSFFASNSVPCCLSHNWISLPGYIRCVIRQASASKFVLIDDAARLLHLWLLHLSQTTKFLVHGVTLLRAAYNEQRTKFNVQRYVFNIPPLSGAFSGPVRLEYSSPARPAQDPVFGL